MLHALLRPCLMAKGRPGKNSNRLHLQCPICVHAGQCVGLKPLPEHSQPIKGCPRCKEPITGIRRYGRVINKAVTDLMDRKFAGENRMALQRVEAALTELRRDPDAAAQKGQLGKHVLEPIFQGFHNIAMQGQHSPSLRVPCAPPASNLPS